MDWQNKFYSIVRETEENLAKAKLKLASKSLGLSSSSQRDPCSPQYAVSAQGFSQSIGGAGPSLLKHQQPVATVPYHYKHQTEELNMSAASGIQVLHMQEQIDAQNRTIDQLNKLVRSLDRERDFYKEQISHLQGEVNTLSAKMGHQLTLAGSERQMSRIKQEVIQEIDKVKTMLYNQSRSPRVGASNLSPRLDDELWNVKENLTESLEHIRRELRLMNKRIDRMESGISSDSLTKHDTTSSQGLNTSRLQRSPRSRKYTYTPAIDNGLDVNQLRSTINLLNTKLDSLETKIDASSHSQPGPAIYSPFQSNTSCVPVRPYTEPFLPPSYDVEDVDDLSSLSGLSDLSDLSEGGENDDLDEEVDAIIKRSSSARRHSKLSPGSYSKEKSSIYKPESRKKGKVDFDLSDLDLSDVEAAEVDSDGLDL